MAQVKPPSSSKDDKHEGKATLHAVVDDLDQLGTATESDLLVHGILSPQQVENKWEGLLSFLNHSICYNEDMEVSDKPHVAISTTNLNAWKMKGGCRAMYRRFVGALRRLKAVCAKRGRLTRVPPTALCAPPRNFVGALVMSNAVQGLVLFVIAIDMLAAAYGFRDLLGVETSEDSEGSILAFTVVDGIVIAVLGLEVFSRCFYMGAKFKHSWLNLMELALIPLAVADFVTRGDQDSSGPPPALLRVLRPVFRAFNLILKAYRGFNRVRQFRMQLQLQVSGCHRRWREGGVDLDLQYVTRNVIAMGRPAVGVAALYNNPIHDVARFFEERHLNNYLVINANDKCDYPLDVFMQRVVLFPVPETSVPKLSDLWELCSTIREFLDRDKQHVVAVHAHLGCGRVGLAISAWLLYSNEFQEAAEATNYVERRFTDPNSSTTVQAFDCASQQRFVEYFAHCVQVVAKVPDPVRKVRLRTIKLLGVEAEVAASLCVKCFTHATKTTPRHPAATFSSERSNVTSGGMDDEDEQGMEAVLLIENEEEVVLEAKRESEKQTFDSVASGCKPLTFGAVMDSSDKGDLKVLSFTGDEVSHTDVVVWQIDNLELQGEICFEIHQLREEDYASQRPGKRVDGISDVFGDGEDTNLLFSVWLHTSFLEMQQGQDGVADDVNRLDRKNLCVVLGRFDLDKGAGAPSLRSYGSSFEVQLLFEVDEHMHFENKDGHGQVSESLREYGIARLQGPSPNDVSEPFSLQWLEWCVGRLWPFIQDALKKMLEESLEPALKAALPKAFGTVEISKFELGSSTPELGPVMASERAGLQNGITGIQLDINVRYKGNANIIIRVGQSEVGVTQLSLSSYLSLLFNPIEKRLPIIGGMHIFFLNVPVIDLSFVGLAEVANHAFLKDMIQGHLATALAEAIVLPNVLTLNWMPERYIMSDPISWLSSMLPEGIVRIMVMDVAEDEYASCKPQAGACMPSFLSGAECGHMRREADVYAVFRLGSLERKTKLRLRTHEFADRSASDPCDLLMYDTKQHVWVEVWHHQSIGGATLRGRSKFEELHAMLNAQTMAGGIHRVELKDPMADENSPGFHLSLKAELFELHANRRRLEEEAAQHLEKQPFGDVENGEFFERSLIDSVQPLKAVGLLICKVQKGCLPKEKPAGEYSLTVRVGKEEVTKFFTDRDTSWQELAEISDTEGNTIEALVQEGFTAERIATMLKLQDMVIAKVIADRAGFNAELQHHFCILVTPEFISLSASDPSDKSEKRGEKSVSLPDKVSLQKGGVVQMEIRHKRVLQASVAVPLSAIQKATGMATRKLVEFSPVGEPVDSNLEVTHKLDVDLRLMAHVPKRLLVHNNSFGAV